MVHLNDTPHVITDLIAEPCDDDKQDDPYGVKLLKEPRKSLLELRYEDTDKEHVRCVIPPCSSSRSHAPVVPSDGTQGNDKDAEPVLLDEPESQHKYEVKNKDTVDIPCIRMPLKDILLTDVILLCKSYKTCESKEERNKDRDISLEEILIERSLIVLCTLIHTESREEQEDRYEKMSYKDKLLKAGLDVILREPESGSVFRTVMENDTECAKAQDGLCLREGHGIFVPLFELAELSADKKDRKPHCDPDPIGILNQDIHKIHPANKL